MSSFDYDTSNPFLWAREEELRPVWDDADAMMVDAPSHAFVATGGHHALDRRAAHSAPFARPTLPTRREPESSSRYLGPGEFDEAEVVFESPVGSLEDRAVWQTLDRSPSLRYSGVSDESDCMDMDIECSSLSSSISSSSFAFTNMVSTSAPTSSRRFSQPQRSLMAQRADNPRRHSQPDLARRLAAVNRSEMSYSDVETTMDGDNDELDDGMDDDVEPQTSVVTPNLTLPDPPASFKLPVSKSPIMDALCYCALQGWGLRVVQNKRSTLSSAAEVVFLVEDFDRYYRISRSICSKQNPTEDIGARVKALRRWFSDFPTKRDRTESDEFYLHVRGAGVKKVRQLLDVNARLLGLK